jgi:flagellar motor switch protein FliM
VSERVLEQSEIDRLVAAVRRGEIATRPGALARLRHARRIDFRAGAGRDRIVRRRLPVLDLVLGRLVPALQITLTKSLRFPVRLEAAAVELKKFGDLREQLAERRTLLEVMRLDPLRGSSVLVIDSVVLYALVDALMGGLGIAEPPADREISDIEIGVVSRVLLDVLRDLENAWRPWFPLRVEHVRSERNTQLMSAIPADEVCHVATVLVTADVLPQTPIHFVMPYGSLEPLHQAISARVGAELDPNWRLSLEQSLRESEVEVAAVLGRAELSAARVRSLAPGELIQLDTEAGHDLPVLVEGEEVFRGRLGKSGHQYGLKITSRRETRNRMADRQTGQLLVRKGLISREQLAVAEVDEILNRRSLVDSIVGRGWVERRVLEQAIATG